MPHKQKLIYGVEMIPAKTTWRFTYDRAHPENLRLFYVCGWGNFVWFRKVDGAVKEWYNWVTNLAIPEFNRYLSFESLDTGMIHKQYF